MQDPFTRQPTCIHGGQLPSAPEQSAVLDGHRRRLRTLDRLVEAAAQCGIRADQDRDLVLLQDGEISLLETAGGVWGDFASAIRDFRAFLPLIGLERFGFSANEPDPFEVNSPAMYRIGAGVEALAFQSPDNSIYKFFLFRKGGDVGATFHFEPGEEAFIFARAMPGNYRQLIAKLKVTHEIGMPTEIIAITPEGILVAKQTMGRALSPDRDVSTLEPTRFMSIPSRFLRADRDHPRLAFVDDEPWLLADTHNRNVVLDEDGALRIIDLVAAPIPNLVLRRFPAFAEWIELKRHDPAAEALPGPDNDL